MAQLPNVRVNYAVPFPSRVVGTGVIVVSKLSAIWTVKLDFTQLPVVDAGMVTDPTVEQFLMYNSAAKTYGLMTLSGISAFGGSVSPKVVSATPYNVLPTDTLLEIDVVNCVINIGSSVGRAQPLLIKDITGNNEATPHTLNGTVDGVVNPNVAGNFALVSIYPSGAAWRFYR